MPTPWEWPDELDAVLAAPDYHVLLFENELVRVLDISIPPGETVPLHTHRWPGTLYLLSWGDFVRRDATGAIMFDSRTSSPPLPGTSAWSPPMPPHTLENVDSTPLRLIGTELKSTSAPSGQSDFRFPD